MISEVKRAEGSIQQIERIPADLRAVYRTAWEIPQRSLIEMAADRGSFIDQSQSLNLFMEAPTIGKLSSMYMHAWKQGLKTTYYLRSRPATRINQTTTNGHNPTAAEAGRCGCVLAGESRDVRGVRLMAITDLSFDHLDGLDAPAREAGGATAPAAVRSNILDPGFDLTLRPMRYPQFFEMYRDAIKNTWTVDEIDFSDDLVDLDRKLMPAEKHLIRRLVAFFATGDSIVANNLVLNLYEHINAPEARMYLSRQLFEEALHVQFYLNLLDSYIPDHDERAEAFAAIETIPSIRAKAEFCFKWMDSVGRRATAHCSRPSPVPAEPGVLRGVHRGSVLLRGVRLRVFSAIQGAAQRAGRWNELGVPRRVDAHELRVRGDPHGALRGARAVRRGSGAKHQRDAGRGRGCRAPVRG